MSTRRPGTCREPGPYAAHCTNEPGHSWSCYDAGEDTSWNDRSPEEWQTETPHDCDDQTCPDRRTPAPLAAPAPPCLQCGPGYRIGDEGCHHTARDRQTWERRLGGTDVAETRIHLDVGPDGRALVHEALLAQLLVDAGWERAS